MSGALPTTLRAKDILNDHVVVVNADRRPAELIECMTCGTGGAPKHVAVIDDDRLCGLVGIKELETSPPERIIGDLVAEGSKLSIAPQIPLAHVRLALQNARPNAAAVIDDTGSYWTLIPTEYLPEGNGELIAFTGDITERARAENAIRESEAMPDGRVKHVNTRCRTPCDELGSPVRSVGTVQDISGRTLIEEERARTGQCESLKNLAGGIAHEFNSMLLAAGIYLMDGTPDAPSEHDPSLAKAASLVQQAQSLSASLLELFAGPEIVESPILPIAAWLPECVGRLADLLPVGVSVKLAPQSGVKPVRADPLAIEQVLRILLSNASDAISGRGDILVTLAPCTGPEEFGGRADSEGGLWVEVRVIDQGHGIPEADRLRIFEPFFTTRNRARRSGLGLAIAIRLVEQAGGSMTFEPNNPQGSVFVIKLRSTPEHQMTTTLAIADDHEILRDAFSGPAAKAAGFEVVASVGDAQSAVIACREHKPDLLVLDIEMPGRDALAAIADVRAVSSRTKVVILSAYCRDSFIRLAMDHGVAGYLVKSDPPALILEALTKIARGTSVYSRAVLARLSRGGIGRDDQSRRSTRFADLSPRELEVLGYIGRGMSNDQMADVMFLSKRTVERHVAGVMDVTGIRERAGLIKLAYEEGLVI